MCELPSITVLFSENRELVVLPVGECHTSSFNAIRISPIKTIPKGGDGKEGRRKEEDRNGVSQGSQVPSCR